MSDEKKHNEGETSRPDRTSESNESRNHDKGSWIGGFSREEFNKSEPPSNIEYISKPKITQEDTNDEKKG
jgi:hypothetical protein